jgi:alanine--tRNA ligase
LIVPQFCLRFNDIENVGVTMSHTTGFTMIGQHAFQEETEWDQDKYFEDLLSFFLDVVEIPKNDLIIHEDVWAGGGNLGPCMEFFSGGLELANQVYMLYEVQGEDREQLPIKVLDMGMGHERIAWFTAQTPTMYHAMFPETMRYVMEETETSFDEDLLRSFTKYAARLNDDEVEDIDAAWTSIAEDLEMSVEDVKGELQGFTDVVRVVEHVRSVAVAISDGALPSNVRGGHNLRVILRKALSIIDRNDWDVTVQGVAEHHAKELEGFLPSLAEHIDNIKQVLGKEVQRYKNTKQRQKRILDDLEEVDEDTFIELYDSHGIQPEQVVDALAEKGVDATVPSQFWKKVTARHQDSMRHHRSQRFDTTDIEKTKRLYYENYDKTSFKAVVEKIIREGDERWVVLDRTAFYPTSGGQEHDTGSLGGGDVKDVVVERDVVLHLVEGASFQKGEEVKGRIDFDRRLQLTQHHTATHILTGSAYEVLGNHVWQAGASKKVDKARIDLTHYENLSDEDVQRIEERANKVVQENLPVTQRFYNRSDAESKYGFRLYQGGAVPGNNIRVVEIDGFDAEACGGTHVPVTGDVGPIEVMKSTKVQDGVVRLEFVAGEKAKEKIRRRQAVIDELKEKLDCDNEAHIPGRCEELFKRWKDMRKGRLETFQLESEEVYGGDILGEAARRLKTQKKHVVKTVDKFRDQILESVNE